MLNTSGQWIRKGKTIVLFGLGANDREGEAEAFELEDRAPAAGPPPGPAPDAGLVTGSVAGRIVAEARKHIGYEEGANNSNKFSAHFGVPNVAWCVYFVSYCLTMAGIPMNIGSSDALLEYLRRTGKFVGKDQVPKPGYVVVFDWNPNDSDPAEHGGIVESVYRDASGKLRITTIEGNSGNAVSRRFRAADDRTIVGYGRMT